MSGRRLTSAALAVGLLVTAAAPWPVSAAPINFAIANLLDPGAEGPEIQRPYVTAGKKRLAFRPPQNCQLSSSPEAMTLFLSEAGVSSQVIIANSPFPPTADLRAEIETYHKTAEGTLPKEAEETDFKGANTQMYNGHDWKSLAFEWTYNHFAHLTYRQIAYVNIDPEHQVQITIVCDQALQAKTTGFVRRFLTSWYWLDDAK